MKNLTQNIKNVFGKEGEDWLSKLPSLVEMLCTHWNLSHVTPVNNMSFNYVAKAIMNADQPVILKIGCDKKSINAERQALTYFAGQGAVKLIDYSDDSNALLLQEALPGKTLKSFYPAKDEFVIDKYADVVRKLHSKHLSSSHDYLNISDWLQAIDHLTAEHIPGNLLQKALTLKKHLLASPKPHVFLHGDLHHDNIVENGNEWLAIDPKGIVGEPEFEVAAFDFIHASELSDELKAKQLFLERVERLAQRTGLDAERIKDWALVRLILSVAWSVEDHCDPSSAIKLASILF